MQKPKYTSPKLIYFTKNSLTSNTKFHKKVVAESNRKTRKFAHVISNQYVYTAAKLSS